MQLIKEKLKQIYIPINTGSLALFISLGESEFSGNVGIKGELLMWQPLMLRE